MGYVRPHVRNGRRVRGYYRSDPHLGAGAGGVLLAIILVMALLYGLGHA